MANKIRWEPKLSGNFSIGYEGTLEQKCKIWGPVGPAELEAYINSLSVIDWPKGIAGYGISAVNYDLIRDKVGDQEPFWDISVTYDRKKPPVGDYRLSFDSNGTTARLFASKEHVASFGTSTDYQGAIDVKDGKAEGVEIIVPGLRLDVEATIAENFISWDYIKKVSEIVGTVNEKAMWGHAPGELLFLGCSGSMDLPIEDPASSAYYYDTNWIARDTTLKFSWLASKNELDLTIGEITGIEKKGHEYIWLEFRPEADAGKVITRPLAIYVEKVYDEADHRAVTKIGIAPEAP